MMKTTHVSSARITWSKNVNRLRGVTPHRCNGTGRGDTPRPPGPRSRTIHWSSSSRYTHPSKPCRQVEGTQTLPISQQSMLRRVRTCRPKCKSASATCLFVMPVISAPTSIRAWNFGAVCCTTDYHPSDNKQYNNKYRGHPVQQPQHGPGLHDGVADVAWRRKDGDCRVAHD